MSDETKQLLSQALVNTIKETDPASIDQALHQAVILKIKELQAAKAGHVHEAPQEV